MHPDAAYQFVQSAVPEDATEEYRAGWREAAIAFHRALERPEPRDADTFYDITDD